jgi:hypothetical protein
MTPIPKSWEQANADSAKNCSSYTLPGVRAVILATEDSHSMRVNKTPRGLATHAVQG